MKQNNRSCNQFEFNWKLNLNSMVIDNTSIVSCVEPLLIYIVAYDHGRTGQKNCSTLSITGCCVTLPYDSLQNTFIASKNEQKCKESSVQRYSYRNQRFPSRLQILKNGEHIFFRIHCLVTSSKIVLNLN